MRFSDKFVEGDKPIDLGLLYIRVALMNKVADKW